MSENIIVNETIERLKNGDFSAINSEKCAELFEALKKAADAICEVVKKIIDIVTDIIKTIADNFRTLIESIYPNRRVVHLARYGKGRAKEKNRKRILKFFKRLLSLP